MGAELVMPDGPRLAVPQVTAVDDQFGTHTLRPGLLRLRRRRDGIPAQQLVTLHGRALAPGHPGAEARRRRLVWLCWESTANVVFLCHLITALFDR